MAKIKTVLAWTLQVLLAIQIFLPGQSKFTMIEAWSQRMEKWGYSPTFMYAVGTLEMVAAVLVLIPRTVGYGVLIITVIMTGAMVTHLMHSEAFLRPLVMMFFAAAIFVLRKPSVFGRNFGKG